MNGHVGRSVFAVIVVIFCGGIRAVAEETHPETWQAHAQGSPARLGSDAGSLYLRTGTVDLRDKPSLLASDVAFNPKTHYVIQLDGPMTRERRARLEAQGVRLGRYLPMYAYIANLGDTTSDALLNLQFVAWVGPFEDAWKICPRIGKKHFVTSERRRLERAGKKRLVVSLFKDVDVASAVSRIGEFGGTTKVGVVFGQARQMGVEIAGERLGALRGIDEVMFIEEAAEGVPRNATTTWICQSNNLDATPLWDAGLHGEGQMAGIIDWAMREGHCAFADPDGNPIGPTHRKIEAYYGLGVPSGYAYHGTHVTGVFAGEDLDQTDSNLRGMAYESRVVFQHYNSVITSTNLNERLIVAHDHGARVHNNSWGSSNRNYIAWSRDIDVFTRNHEDDLVLVAVDNYGQVKSPENAKNCLGVAATNDTPNQESKCYGAYGPTLDGRQKPEVWAPGCGSYSAGTTPCNMHSGGGTSYATPAVAGMGLLVRQYFMEGFYPGGIPTSQDAFIPSGATLKATLINSAVDMTGFGSYFTGQEGWGRILVDDALYFAGDARRLVVEDVRNEAGLSTGEADTYFVPISTSDGPLKITVVWTDVPAVLLASFTPVNNLDLVVTDPGGTVYLGNVFSGIESATGGTPDEVNNAEQVHRNTPTPGTWRIDVIGTAVNESAQGYALVVTGDVPETYWLAPDQLHLAGPLPNHVTVGTEGAITATVESNFVGVPGREVVFTKLIGDFTFTSGAISPDGNTSSVATGENGTTEMTFIAGAVGTGIIGVSVTGSELPTAFSIFEMVDDDDPMTPGDFDSDGDIGSDDLTIFCNVLLDSNPTQERIKTADMNGDGLADGRDIQAFVQALNHRDHVDNGDWQPEAHHNTQTGGETQY